MALPSAYDAKLWLALLHEDTHCEVARSSQRTSTSSLGSISLPSPMADILLKNVTGGNKWTNRIQWTRHRLADRGCLDAGIHGTWRITSLGREWLLANWQGSDADYSAVVKPALVTKPKSPAELSADDSMPSPRVTSSKAGRPSSVAVKPVEAASPTMLTTPTLPADPTGADPIEDLCGRLQRSQLQSSAPEQFERDLAEAFSALGFEARHIGGSGETDVYVEARLSQSSYSAVVDAKSTASGRVPDAQINWSVIDAHRQARGATFAAVIGPGFGGGQLLKFASQYNVVLLTTEMICELVRLHALTPFSLFELRDLFMSPGIADGALRCLRERHVQHRRHWALASQIIQRMDGLSQVTPNGLKADNLYYYLLAVSGSKTIAEAPTQQYVADAIAFLASRAVGVLAEVPGSGGAYQLGMSTKTARERLAALARAFGQKN